MSAAWELELIAALCAQGVLSALDVQLARGLCALAGEDDPSVQLAIALLSRQVAAGHVCLPLSELATAERALGPEGCVSVQTWPALPVWVAALRASPLCDPNEPASPLVIDGADGLDGLAGTDGRQRLYFRRHYACERRLAELLLGRTTQRVLADEQYVAARLQHHFGSAPDDLQRRAAELATRRGLCVISGGPGTGKTSTVVRVLAVAIEQALSDSGQVPRIALTAPTGKAAVRLQSAVLGAKQRLDCEPRVLAAIPEAATTIHRLLASSVSRDRSEVHVQPDRLALDLLLVDEASMVDVELMTQLLAALSEHARVILLGDRDQLASVEAGAVLGDICAAGGPNSTGALASCIVQLTRSYRYAADSGIGHLARAVQAGDAQRALEILDDASYPDVTLHDDAGSLLDPEGPFASAVIAGYRPYLTASQPDRALSLFEGFRVLAAHRQGERGVVALNRAIARLLAQADLVPASEGNFIGRPLMIMENDYRTRLWNGDVGVIRDAEEGARCAYFLDPEGNLRRLGLGRLPPHESAFALSVHKSQGSEVDEVSLVLPAQPSRILSRELVYTAITRARKRVVIHGSRAVFGAAIAQVVSRNTGLQDLLRVSA